MRLDRFTIKSQALIQSAQSLASQSNHQQIEPEHLLRAMLEDKESVAVSIIRKLGAEPRDVLRDTHAILEKLPRVQGGADAFISPRTRKILEAAVVEAGKMKDQYVSIEHLLLAIIDDKACQAAKILSGYGINRDSLLQGLMEIRGTQRITDQNPEEK